MSWLEDRAIAVVTGAAVGDALGGAVEGWTPEQIEERHGGRVEGIVAPWFPNWREARPIAPYYKGDGHVTDDTLMTQLLVEVYAKRRSHLDAYAMASDMVPLMIGEPRWVPELDMSALVLQRVFLAEKWLVARLHYGHVDPREAGVGNIVNCGAAMYMAPVGVVNPGDPRAAYTEAIDIAGAHQSSYGREAAGVFAAMVAAALSSEATVDSVTEEAISLAHDGTKGALIAVAEAAKGFGRVGSSDEERRRFQQVLREAVAPFDTVGDAYREMSMDARRPSRTKSIEELPVALGMIIGYQGDYKESVLGAVNYGRDADSIAVMAGAVCSALGGSESVPSIWLDQVEAASKMDIRATGRLLGAVATEIVQSDLNASQRRAVTLDQVLHSKDG
ncbi:ADP-ribosylglycohydrolase family protein [Actinomycetaceae bacterium MB13-C1-2]|nr:ADP-ribosylglycohydrolase family protein [Actinomycetaceae bacterium MB13-C1-2]